MAQHDLARAAPADWDQIADAATDDQPRRSGLMTEIAMGIEERTRVEAVSKLERDGLTSVEMTC
jgi:hypothetical protein